MKLTEEHFWLAASFVVALMAGSQHAVGHSWFPWECCSDRDCQMVEAKSITRDDTSWLLPNGERVPFENTRESLDENFHWCRYTNGARDPIIRPSGKAPCFFAPKGGV